MANFDESSAGYNWETEGVYQIEKNDPVEGGPDGISNRQGRQLTRRTRDLHTRLVALKTQADGLIGQIMGGSVDADYNTLLKLQNKLRAVESAINGDNGDALIETLQEALGFINDHKSEIESLVNTYVKKTSVADNLTTTSAGYVLSANQGKVLKGLIDALTEEVGRKETPAGAQQKANAALASARALLPFDYVVDSNAALAGLNNNANATCVLIKKGTWTAPSSGILLHPNTKRIVGEPGSIIRYSGAGLACFYYADVPDAGAGYNIQGVTVAMTNIAVGFYQMVNMENCVCECAKVSSQEESSCFHTCSSLTHCGAFLHERYHAADGFYLCENLVQCKVQSDKTGNYALGIRQCNGVVQCYSDCSIDGCCNVFMCKTNLYVGSYYSSTENTTYRCADTLNGGWNKTITV